MKTARLVYTLQRGSRLNNPNSIVDCSFLTRSYCSLHSTLSFNLYSHRVQRLIGRKLLQRRNEQKKPPCTWQWEMKLEIGMRTKCRMRGRIRKAMWRRSRTRTRKRIDRRKPWHVPLTTHTTQTYEQHTHTYTQSRVLKMKLKTVK